MVGQSIAHYRVLEKLGEGGMGVVYKARDTHLDRFVAIKVLPPERVADPERKWRFMQEAKAASALNHPNIVVIHDISQAEGIDFMVMEFVPGKTLHELIPRRGMHLNDALKYGIQIADALARAHAAGIVHRDLKPGNVMVDEHGLVKVLDFGLAKLVEAPVGQAVSPAAQDEPTRTLKPETAEGVIVGTVGYMSPELAQGKPVDARSDIFSLGSLLYEMVTGRRAFRGDTNMSTLAAIINKEPAPMGEETPGELRRLVARCLRKDPARRFQTMADLKVALEDLKEDSDSGALEAKATPPRRPRWLWAATLPVLFLVAALAYWLVRPASQPAAGPLKAVPLTAYPGQEWSPTFSPDGNQVAFSWNGEKQDNFDIYVLMIGTGARLRLTQDPATDYSSAWSPDGRYVAFLRQLPQGRSAVLLVPPIGGPERKLAEIAATFFLVYPQFSPRLAWSPDGRWLAASNGPALVLISTETGEQRELPSPPPPRRDAHPAFSPDGRTLAFVRYAGFAGDLWALRLSQDLKPVGEPKRLAGDRRSPAGPYWMPRGDEIVFSWGFLAGHGLWRIPAAGAGEPSPVAVPGVAVYEPVLSRQGSRLAYVQKHVDSDIWRIELGRPGGKATRVSRLISSTRSDLYPQFSPDGKRIAFSSRRSGNPEIWVCDADGSNPVQLTFFDGPVGGTPRWSPDGESIVFDQRAAGDANIYVVSARGGKPHRLTLDSAEDTVPSWSRDGRWIYYASARGGSHQVWKIPAAGGEPVQVTKQGGYAALESFDGKYVYYAKSGEGNATLWRLRLADGEEAQVLESLHMFGNFAIAEDGVYFIPEQKPGATALLQFLEFSTGAVHTIATIEKPVRSGLAVSPDGRSILYAQAESLDSDLMLVENFR